MEKKIMVCGWNVTITAEHKIVKVENGFTFSMKFCIGHADWNEKPVYFVTKGFTETLGEVFKDIETMRAAYRARLGEGWNAF